MSSHACEARDDPRVYIVGYGSLMSIESARRTMPDLDDFTPALIFGWRRHFNLVSISALRRGLVSDDALRTGHVAAVTVRGGYPVSDALLVSLFRIPSGQVPGYLEREARYRFETVDAYPIATTALSIDDALDNPSVAFERGQPVRATICVQFEDDEALFRERFHSDATRYYEDVGQFYSGRLYRKDIFPMQDYLRLCLDAARRLARDKGVRNFLTTSYLADERTPLSQYVVDHCIGTSNPEQ
ncbi:Gamma-glutamylcyclotransferase [Plasmodiophora brassicae]|nr:hypothetical protein PBRA_000479 [Plasmodiophora brassicae]